MADRLKTESRHKMYLRLLLLFGCTLMTGLCSGQEAAKPPSVTTSPAVHDDLEEAINEVQGGNYA
jgi:hypothetical protein